MTFMSAHSTGLPKERARTSIARKLSRAFAPAIVFVITIAALGLWIVGRTRTDVENALERVAIASRVASELRGMQLAEDRYLTSGEAADLIVFREQSRSATRELKALGARVTEPAARAQLGRVQELIDDYGKIVDEEANTVGGQASNDDPDAFRDLIKRKREVVAQLESVGGGVLDTEISRSAPLLPGSFSRVASLFIGAAAAMILSFICTWWFGRRTVAGIATITAAIRTAASEPDRRVATDFDDELGELGETFNSLLDCVATRTRELLDRNDAMRVVLDNVDQGLATIRMDGTLDPERSAAFDTWLGASTGEANFAEHVGRGDLLLRDTLSLGWETVTEDFLPLEAAIEQFPKRLERDGLHFELGYKPIYRHAKLAGMLLMVTNVTATLAARREEEKQREYVRIFERVVRDRDGFLAFVSETNALLRRLEAEVPDARTAMMIIHTVKGNAAQWGVTSVATIAHDLEAQILDCPSASITERQKELCDAWATVTRRLQTLGGQFSDRIEISRDEVDRLLAAIQARAPYDELAEKLERVMHEPTRIRFQRAAEQAERLARRLEKPTPEIRSEPNDVRLSASRYGAFWASSVHLVRNMMDHGIERPEDRIARGKPPAGRILLRSTMDVDSFVLEFADDGAGIDWEKVREKARQAGLPSSSMEDLERALFAPNISTAETVTDISGRGVGLSAVAEACAALHGKIQIHSTSGEGVRFVFTFPRREDEDLGRLAGGSTMVRAERHSSADHEGRRATSPPSHAVA
jgi:signal transduction histidine kinase